MGVSALRGPSTECSNRALIVSSDKVLANRLRTMLEQGHRCQVEVASSYRHAEAMLRGEHRRTVFVDLREAATTEDPSALLHCLSQPTKHRAPVLAVSDAGYVCDWASVADLIIRGHLHLPLDRKKLAALLQDELLTTPSEARLIVASNVDLEQLMQQKKFRADLYYRLNVLEFHIPPLRKRPRDIVPLALDFVEEFCSAHGVHIRRVHPAFLKCLKRYAWPGNVRELKNHVRRAVLFCRSGELTPKDLAPHLAKAGREDRVPEQPALPFPSERATLSQKVAASERALLERALREHDHNRTATARSLGLSRVGLYKKMKKYGMTGESQQRKKG